MGREVCLSHHIVDAEVSLDCLEIVAFREATFDEFLHLSKSGHFEIVLLLKLVHNEHDSTILTLLVEFSFVNMPACAMAVSGEVFQFCIVVGLHRFGIPDGTGQVSERVPQLVLVVSVEVLL